MTHRGNARWQNTYFNLWSRLSESFNYSGMLILLPLQWMLLENRGKRGTCYLHVSLILYARIAMRIRSVVSQVLLRYCALITNLIVEILHQRSILLSAITSPSRQLMSSTAKLACDLIAWLWSKTYILAQVREVQGQSGQHPRSVICAILTRWTAHYLAFSRLLELQHPLKVLVNQDAMAEPDKKILVPSSRSKVNKQKVRDMVAIIEDGAFWHTLAWYDFIQLNTVVSYLVYLGIDSRIIWNPSQKLQMWHRLHFAGSIKFSSPLACFACTTTGSGQMTQVPIITWGVWQLLTALRSTGQRQNRRYLLPLLS